MPKVKICLFLVGNDVDLDAITDSIEIVPTIARKQEEWPKASRDAGLARDGWMWETDKVECNAVSVQMDQLQKIFSAKVNVIRALCVRCKLNVSVTIVAEMSSKNEVELVLSKENIAFLSLLNAEVGFDLYID